MANLPISNLFVKPLGSFDVGKAFGSFDVDMPSQTNKENIMSLDNMSHTISSSSELMDYSEELEEKEMSQELSPEEIEMPSQEPNSEGNEMRSQERSEVTEMPSQELEIPAELEELSQVIEIPPSDNDSDNSTSSSLDEGLRSSKIVSRKRSLSEPEDGELAYEDETFFMPKVPKRKLTYASAEKLHERAKRFGMNVSHNDIISETTLSALYKSLDIPLDQVGSGKLRSMRLNTIHMRGVEEMDTSDVIQYFNSCDPVSVEWINDFSCNVMFKSDLSAAKAMVNVSSEIPPGIDVSKNLGSKASGRKVPDKDNIFLQYVNEGEKFEGTERDVTEKGKMIASLFATPVPPGKWRQGQSCAKAKSILLRFSTKDDKKLPGAEKRSIYYQKYGNPNYGGLKGLITSSRKRKYVTSSRKDDYLPVQSSGHNFMRSLSYSDDDDENDEDILSAGGKRIRMHMYADDIDGGSWQRINAPPKTGYKNQASKRRFKINCDNSAEVHKHHSKTDVPSRYKIWNPIAETMAKEAELAERSQDYHRSSRFQHKFIHTDLRHKISMPHASTSSNRFVNVNVDLRKKLQRMRRANTRITHRSPLLISVSNKNPDESETSS